MIHTSRTRYFQEDRQPGWPMMWKTQYDKPWYPGRILEWEVMPRDGFGVPAQIPPDLSTIIQHTFYIPPDYYPFLKKLGDDDPNIKPYMDKLIMGELTWANYEEMFYKSAKPLKVYRSRLPMPYRTEAEELKEAEMHWESKWLSYRQRVLAEYMTRFIMRQFITAILVGLWTCQLWMTQVQYYQEDMKLYYIEAPEHKINWVVPRGDL